MTSAMIGSRPVVGSSKKMISGAGGDGAGKADAFLHAAGKLCRREIGDVGAEADLSKRLDRPLLGFVTRHALDLDQTERDILPDRQAVEKGCSLKQHTEFMHHLLALAAGEGGHLLTVDLDAAFVRIENAEDTFQENGFSGAGTADHDHRFALADIQIDAAQDVLAAEAFFQAADFDFWRGGACG